VAQVQVQKKRLPVIIVGNFKNGSDEHMYTGILSNRLEAAILRIGKADYVAAGDLRSEIRAERVDQQLGYTSDETAAALGKEQGADFILTGTVKTMIDQAGKTSIRTYFVTAELTDIETNRRIWIGEHNDIKKVIKTPGVKL
jgi:TolB-like protein